MHVQQKSTQQRAQHLPKSMSTKREDKTSLALRGFVTMHIPGMLGISIPLLRQNTSKQLIIPYQRTTCIRETRNESMKSKLLVLTQCLRCLWSWQLLLPQWEQWLCLLNSQHTILTISVLPGYWCSIQSHSLHGHWFCIQSHSCLLPGHWCSIQSHSSLLPDHWCSIQSHSRRSPWSLHGVPSNRILAFSLVTDVPSNRILQCSPISNHEES